MRPFYVKSRNKQKQAFPKLHKRLYECVLASERAFIAAAMMRAYSGLADAMVKSLVP